MRALQLLVVAAGVDPSQLQRQQERGWQHNRRRFARSGPWRQLLDSHLIEDLGNHGRGCGGAAVGALAPEAKAKLGEALLASLGESARTAFLRAGGWSKLPQQLLDLRRQRK